LIAEAINHAPEQAGLILQPIEKLDNAARRPLPE
jgi:hypothetical protein